MLHQRRGLVQSDHGLDAADSEFGTASGVSFDAQRLALNRVVGERGAERRGDALARATHGLDVLVVVGHVADPEALGPSATPRRLSTSDRARGERGAVLRGGEELAVLRVARAWTPRGESGGRRRHRGLFKIDPEVDLLVLVRTSRPCGRLAPRTGHCPPGRSCRCRVRQVRGGADECTGHGGDTERGERRAGGDRHETSNGMGWSRPSAPDRAVSSGLVIPSREAGRVPLTHVIGHRKCCVWQPDAA